MEELSYRPHLAISGKRNYLSQPRLTSCVKGALRFFSEKIFCRGAAKIFWVKIVFSLPSLAIIYLLWHISRFWNVKFCWDCSFVQDWGCWVLPVIRCIFSQIAFLWQPRLIFYPGKSYLSRCSTFIPFNKILLVVK